MIDQTPVWRNLRASIDASKARNAARRKARQQEIEAHWALTLRRYKVKVFMRPWEAHWMAYPGHEVHIALTRGVGGHPGHHILYVNPLASREEQDGAIEAALARIPRLIAERERAEREGRAVRAIP